MRPRGQVTIVAAFHGWLDLASESCPDCEITEDLGRHLGADAVLFHIPTTPALPRVAADEDEYASYLAWRSKPLDERLVALVEEQREPPLCHLCRLVAS